MVDAYYLGFSAFVQLAAGFCLAVLYINRNDDNKSLFVRIYRQAMTGVTKNYFLKLLLHNTKSIYIHKKNKPLLHKLKALTIESKNKFEATVNINYSCLMLTVSGIVSAIFSIAWLYITPFATKGCDNIKDIYLTFCFSTFLASVVIVGYAIMFNKMNRVKALMLSIAFTLLFNLIGYNCLRNNIHISTEWDFNRLFNLSLIISYLPFVYYILSIIINISFKLGILVYHNLLYTLLKNLIYIEDKIHKHY